MSINIPFVAVVETWLKPCIADSQININDYSVYQADRKNFKNGGVLLYVNNDIIIDYTVSYDDNTCNGIICLSKKSKCFISCIYRPPNSGESSFSKLLKFMENFIQQHDPHNKFYNFIFGDFNLPQISWNNVTSTKNITPEISIFNNFMDKHFFTQYVHENTRKNNILDLFLTENLNFVSSIKVEEINFSDHNLITIFNSYFSTFTKGTVQI